MVQGSRPLSNLGLAAALVALTGALTACSDDAAPTGTVVSLGAVIDRTGSLARPAWFDAATLAIDHANAGLRQAGSFGELQFALRFSDSSGVPQVALRRAEQLVSEFEVKGIVTDTSANAVELNQTHYDLDANNDLGVPLICMACTSASIGNPVAAHPDPWTQRALRDPLGWLYRSTAASTPEAVALLKSAHELGIRGDTNEDGVWKISIYMVDDQFGADFLQSLQRTRDQLFPLIDGEGNFIPGGLRFEVFRHPADADPNTYNWSNGLRQLTDIRNDSPEVNPGSEFGIRGDPIRALIDDGEPDQLIEVTFPLQAASITRAYLSAAEKIRRIPFLHHHNWRHDTNLVKLATSDFEGQRGVSHVLLDNCDASGRTFGRAMLGRTSHPPGIWDAQTYDATMALVLATLIAIEAIGGADPSLVTGKMVRDAFAQLSAASAEAVAATAGPDGAAAAVTAISEGRAIDYVGASGPMNFDDNGNVSNNFVRFRAARDGFVDEELFGCVRDDACPSIETATCGLAE